MDVLQNTSHMGRSGIKVKRAIVKRLFFGIAQKIMLFGQMDGRRFSEYDLVLKGYGQRTENGLGFRIIGSGLFQGIG